MWNVLFSQRSVNRNNVFEQCLHSLVIIQNFFHQDKLKFFAMFVEMLQILIKKFKMLWFNSYSSNPPQPRVGFLRPNHTAFWVEGKILHHHALDMSLLSCVFTLNILPFCPSICCSLGYKISFPDVCLRKYCHVSIQDALAYLLLHFTSHTGIELSHIITRITTRRSLGTTFTWLYYYILLYLLLLIS